LLLEEVIPGGDIPGFAKCDIELPPNLELGLIESNMVDDLNIALVLIGSVS
jgi:hypothetical protein